MIHKRGQIVARVPALLALPAEIRNKIYTCLCHSSAPIRLDFYQDPDSDIPEPVVPYPRDTAIPVDLFLTCRQLNEEASSVFYMENVFVLSRRTRFASLIKPCFISALLKFLHALGSQAAFVRTIVFDTFNLYNSVFLRTHIGKTMELFNNVTDVVEVTLLLQYAWNHGLNFTINLIDVADVDEDRAAYWMLNPDLVRTRTVIAIINSLVDGKLDLKQYQDEVQAVAVKRDGSGGLIGWANSSHGSSPSGPLQLVFHAVTEFRVKHSGAQLELISDNRT